MIEIENATKRYGDKTVVDDVSLQVPSGGITAILGPNGAGKSTLLSMIGRLIPMDGGRISIDGRDVATTRSAEIARSLAVLRQTNHMNARLTVQELVEFGRFPHSRGRLDTTDHEHIETAIDYVGLADERHRLLDHLSGGQRQRAFVAMVLAQDTDHLLLDEPLNNLDMKHSLAMMQLFGRMVSELGKTIVIVLHDINFASFHANDIVAMRDGRVVRQGPPDTIITPEALSAIYDMHIPVHTIDGNRIGVYFG